MQLIGFCSTSSPGGSDGIKEIYFLRQVRPDELAHFLGQYKYFYTENPDDGLTKM